MLLKSKFSVFFLLILYWQIDYAQFDKTVYLNHLTTNPDTDFYHLKNHGGMEQNSITHITQDSIGQMWFATKNGVVRYDSKKFYEYKNNPKNERSIGGNFVERVFVAKNGSIWIGTEPAVLSKYNSNTDDFETIKGISGSRIKDIIQDETGLFWITSDENLYSYNDVTKELKIYTYKKNIAFDRLLNYENHIYITTNEAYVLDFDINNKTFKEIMIIPKKDSVGSRVTAQHGACVLTKDSTGYLWFSSSYGYLIRYNPKNKERTKFIFENKWITNRLTVMFIFEDNKQNLWFGTWFNGLYKISPNRTEIIRFMPNQDNLYSFSNTIAHSGFQDKAGYLWFGTE
ncbi:MAG TPA: hypothetical protein EYG89_00305, partial [Bacteroidia bacterium]|nr:hypothetical protein [Bacteroidia bacterium]